ncbi:hypothetical protein MG293_007978 [Ovis ammon polii]|uniref:Uncharacterized protein n=1 Tax=Ovis ammon polii TaxID=230172 RepID=A0AAD4UE74_OVIAM|nr:hypothetical protein MG293_007978 [Ovis ammon polii]
MRLVLGVPSDPKRSAMIVNHWSEKTTSFLPSRPCRIQQKVNWQSRNTVLIVPTLASQSRVLKCGFGLRDDGVVTGTACHFAYSISVHSFLHLFQLLIQQ